MKIFSIIFLIFSIFSVNIYASVCEKEYSKVEKEVKKYFRIQGHIEEHHSTCNVVYAYSLFLHNAIEMEVLESDIAYAEHLGKFVKEYPYISKFIVDRSTFELFNRYDTASKKTINEATRIVFKKNDYGKKRNLKYILLALDISGHHIEKDKFFHSIKHLKQRYNLDEIDLITIFWASYKNKYSIRSSEAIYEFKDFEKIIDAYSIRTLQKYFPYALEFYPVLLPRTKTNMAYITTIKKLLIEVQRKDTALIQQAYFLKNISVDIEGALLLNH